MTKPTPFDVVINVEDYCDEVSSGLNAWVFALENLDLGDFPTSKEVRVLHMIRLMKAASTVLDEVRLLTRN